MPVTIELSDETARRILSWERVDATGIWQGQQEGRLDVSLQRGEGDALMRLVAGYIKEVQKVKADPDLIQELWNQTFEDHPQVPKVRGLRRSKGRMVKLRERWGEMQAEGDPAQVFADCFDYMAETDFFLGENDRKWIVTFDYLLQNDTKWRQILARSKTEKGGTDSGWTEHFVPPPA